MQIPIENIYYLLCYAWDKLEEKNKVKIELDDNTSLVDLFARILINATKILHRKGIAKNYVAEEEDICGIKGKLNIEATIKRNLLRYNRANCSFDEFSTNIHLNQVIVSTIHKLIKTISLNKNLKEQLIYSLKCYPGVEQIEINASSFTIIKLNRTDRFYIFLINVCQIIYQNSLPSTKPGRYMLSDFTKENSQMNRLFEAFIRNFYRIEQKKFTIKASKIRWRFKATNVNHMNYIPLMNTDITMESLDRKIIIDAKYYKATMSTWFNKEMINSSHLYQIFSYLINQRDGTIRASGTTGILIYPTVNQSYDLDYCFENHPILIRSLNLNTNWKNIAERLHSFVE